MGGNEETEPPLGTPHDPQPLTVQVEHQIGSPVADPTGITFDGEQLWLLDGGHNSPTHRLTRYDDQQLEVTRELVLDNLIDGVLGTGVYGIEWDGTKIWISVSGNRNALVAVDPTTGAIVKTWASPTTLGPSDLAFDGTSMWIGDGTGNVFAMNLATGGIETSFSVTPTLVRDNGIVALSDGVMLNGLFDEGLALFTRDGQLVSTTDTLTGPMTSARDQVVALRQGQIVYYDVH